MIIKANITEFLAMFVQEIKSKETAYKIILYVVLI